jgi:hypothetical protein
MKHDEALLPPQPLKNRRETSKLLLLNNEQLRAIAAACRDIAQVSLASVALPYLLDRFILSLAGLGIAVSIFFWFISHYTLSKLP